MKLRNAGLLVAVLAAAVACDRGQDRGKAPVAPVTQREDPWAKKEAPKDPIGKPLFWKIEKDGKTSYLLGTMHLGVDAHARLPQTVWDKLDAAPAFAMEMDPSQMGAVDLMRKDGKTLRDELGEAYWKKLEDAVGADSARPMLKMKAMVPATMLAMRGLPKTPPMDATLHASAVSKKKKLVYLETLEVEMAVLEKWMNAQALKDMLDDLPGTEQKTKEMLAAYLAGDDAQMLAIYNLYRDEWKKKGRPEAEYDAQMEDALYKRNASWIEPIEKMHAEGGGFITMGAMHAIGPRSVVDLLEKRGFKIALVR